MTGDAARKSATKPKSKPTPPGKAAAEANKKELDETVTPDDGRDVEALREERGELLEEIREFEEAKDQAKVDAAEKAGKHVAKLDDEGAALQQEAARDSGKELYDRLGILTGPPVVAPVLDESGASIKLASRREGEELAKGLDYAEVDRSRFVGFNMHIIGEGFLFPGEVIIDIRRENESDHQRFSAWTDDGNLDTVLPGINGPGDWVVHCEQVVTQVGEGRDDGLPLVKETEPVSLELY